MTTINNYINHIALVLDASGSMQVHGTSVVKVADAEIKHLATRSKELDQETRITVYTFRDNKVECLIYDKDVLRVPSIAGLYKPTGGTPLIDATIKAIEEMSQTATLYGDHSFLQYVITDGEENTSRNKAADLTRTLNRLADNWTVAAFVPNVRGRAEAQRFGFPKDNIQIWDASSARGFEEVGRTIRTVTDTYLRGRASGVRGYRNLFNIDSASLNTSNIRNSNLQALHFGQYRLFNVTDDERIDEFVERKLRRPYRLGEGYYQLMVPVRVQPSKQILILDKRNSSLYKGDDARNLLGLPNYEVRVAPDNFRDYEIFIQSTSVNRKLLAGQKLVVLS